MNLKPLKESLRLGWLEIGRHRIVMILMFAVPLFAVWYFVDMMSEGLPNRVPIAIVDMDHSSLSRKVTRNLSASQSVEVGYTAESFHQAMQDVRAGKIFGFFHIPQNFQRDAMSGKGPTLSYYANLTYYIPGTFAYKGFKVTAVTTSGGVVQTTLTQAGVGNDVTSTLVQPVVAQVNGIHNPWMNYSIYLTNSFAPGMLALMVFLVTAYSICYEIKSGGSREWLRVSDGSMVTILTGKLLPQSVIFSIVGIAMQSILYGYCHFPMHNHLGHMILAMVLLVLACQAFAVAICCWIPQPRRALSTLCLIGILSFSVTGFSFPVQSMYGGIAVFSYVIPLRYYFLIYIDLALNGIPIYYSRWYYVALLIFPIFSYLGLPRLKKRYVNPIYVP